MHFRPANALTLIACGIVAGTALADPDHTYLEKDGIVLFEAEDGTPSEGWQVQTELAGYEGSSYLIWTGSNSFSSDSAGKGNITYHFRIEQAGNYQLLLRSHITMSESNTEHNDSWVRLATGVDVAEEEPLDGWTKLYMNTLGDWTWTSKTVDHVGRPLRQYFAQGDHTVEISGRSFGHAIDRIALYHYEDVPSSANAINEWELSSVVTGDGTVVSPEEITDPAEPPAPEVPEQVDLVNLFSAEPDWADTLNNVCTGDTLALTAISVRSVDPSEPASAYTVSEFLTMSPGTSSILMKFDLSLVPPVISALLEYSTGVEASNGTVLYSLGSHSQWPPENEEEILQPDTMTMMSQASGGWKADTRYQSALPASLLSNDLITLILSSDTGSEPQSLFAYTETARTPRLLLTGEEKFCANWQSNLDARITPVQIPPEVEEETEETSPEVTQKASSGGGSTSWLSLIILSFGMSIRRTGNARSGKRRHGWLMVGRL